jgi:hypothetical protein
MIKHSLGKWKAVLMKLKEVKANAHNTLGFTGEQIAERILNYKSK